MKTRKLTLTSIALMALLMVGTVILMSSVGQEPITASDVKLTPKHIDMQNTAMLDVAIRLDIQDPEAPEDPTKVISIVEDIDPTSVLLQGSIAPISTSIEYNKNDQPQSFHAVFSGSAVKGVIWGILGHMNPSVKRRALSIKLTVTGQLNNGTLWEGIGNAIVVNWVSGDPPPPPP